MAAPAPHPVSGISITQRIIGLCLLVIAGVIAVLLALTVRQFNASIQQQADALGTALSTHAAREVAAPLSLGDNLALAAVLRELVANPYVVHAALYSVDNRTLAEAGQRPRQGRVNSLYTRTIAFEQVIAGQLHININVRLLQQPLYGNLQGLALIGVLLLLAAVMLLSRVARSVSQPLVELQQWLERPTGAAPHQNRGDEIGLLARTLEHSFHPPGETPVLEPAPVLQESVTDEPTLSAPPEPETEAQTCLPDSCAVLAVELTLGQAIHELDDNRRLQLLQHYHEALDEVARLYQGRRIELGAGPTLILFQQEDAECLANALCAAELLRAFAHSLQIEVADSGMTLSMQLGIAEGMPVADLSEGSLLQHPVVGQALELGRYSRNLVLLSASAASHPQTACASIRAIARPAGASCIEHLHLPHSGQLDDQLQGLMLLMLEMDD
ncbi:MAG: hypothetical protein GX665_11165 [Gammaproteobacteria bacterium]|nr:hypothetical protein [Gammaproteobacteria bacterium]